MRERVAVLGGEFAAGARPQGGFRVWASIPSPQL
jgi:signal transduction histidine kinase